MIIQTNLDTAYLIWNKIENKIKIKNKKFKNKKYSIEF